MIRIVILCSLLIFPIMFYGQERKQSISFFYAPSISEMSNSLTKDIRVLYANFTGLEYSFTPWKNWLKLKIGGNYMEHGYRIKVVDHATDEIISGSEKYMLLGLKTTASFQFKGFDIQVGALTQTPFSRRSKYNGELKATDVSHLPHLFVAPYASAGYSLNLKPRVFLAAEIYTSNARALGTRNFGLSIRLGYQFGQEIIPNKKFKL